MRAPRTLLRSAAATLVFVAWPAACDDASVVQCRGGERIVGATSFCWYPDARPGAGFRCPAGAPAQLALDEGVACAASAELTTEQVRGELCTRLRVACDDRDASLDGGDGQIDAGPIPGPDAGGDAAADGGEDAGAGDASPSCAPPSCAIGGACVASGALHPEDPCQRCDADAAPDAWTRNCESVTQTSFEDFRDGTLPRSVGRLYAAAAGDVRWVQTRDVDRDGWADVVVSNHQVGELTETASYVYLGGTGGFSSSRRVELDTVAAAGAAVADLDQDGWPDVVFACGSDSRGRPTPSLVFWGGEAGFSRVRRHLLMDLATATGVATGDLDRDGWLDLVLVDAEGVRLFPGSAEGLSVSWTTGLATTGGYGVALADLDGDGWLDVIVAGQQSVVYWGGADGLASASTTMLDGASGVSLVEVADLDRDGQLDLVFSRHWDPTTFYATRSPILRGVGSRRFEAGPSLETHGALGVCAADLDRDGWLDLVITGYGDQIAGEIVGTYVYRGGVDGFAVADRRELPSHAAFGCDVVDYDLDGELDVFVANNAEGLSHTTTSDVYYGGGAGLGARMTRLPSLGASLGTTEDLGNLFDRQPEEEFLSSAIDLGHGARALRLTWTADTPGDSSVELQLRSATDAEGLTSAPWLGPTSPSDAYRTPGAAVNVRHRAHRFFQYRAVLRSPGFRATPALQSVTLHES